MEDIAKDVSGTSNRCYIVKGGNFSGPKAWKHIINHSKDKLKLRDLKLYTHSADVVNFTLSQKSWNLVVIKNIKER